LWLVQFVVVVLLLVLALVLVFIQELVSLVLAPSIVSLIESNIKDRNARHLMLLTHNDSALSLLFDRHLLALENTVVLFGSDFPQDR
jgi:hypothetical protein